MGDDNNKSNESKDDLLSKLFDLDAQNPDQNPFGEPTKIDNTFVIQKPEKTEALKKIEIPPPKPQEISENLFDNLLEEEPENFSIAAPTEMTELDLGTAGEEIKSETTKTDSIPEITSELLLEDPDLDQTEVKPQPARPQPTVQTAPPVVKPTVSKSVDPIDEALAQFDAPSNRKAKRTKTPAPRLEESSEDEFRSPSASGLKGSLQVPLSVSRLSLPNKSKYIFLGIFLVAGIGAVIFAKTKLSTDEGAFGYRLEGFSLVQAYRAPSESELAEFKKTFDISQQARISDDPEKLEAALMLLRQVLDKDERNLMAAALIMEHSARLMLWEGLKNNWPSQYDEAQKTLAGIKEKKNITESSAEEIRAREARNLVMEDYSKVVTTLGPAVKSTQDETILMLLVEAQIKLGKKSEAQEVLNRLPEKHSPRTKLLDALSKSDLKAVQDLAGAGYLPAKLEEIIGSKITKENTDKLVEQASALKEKLKDYPFLLARLNDFYGDIYAFKGEDEKARERWNETLSVLPRSGPIWLKLARNLEDDAKWDDALASYKSAEKSKSLNEEGNLRYARLLRVRGKVVESLALLDEILKANPKSALAYVEKGLVYTAIYQEEQARAEFAKAVEIDAKFEPAILGLAQISLSRREWSDAEVFLKKIPESSPQFAESLLSLARIALEQNRFKDAEDFYQKSIAKNPKLEDAYVELTRHYLLEEKDEKALELVNRGLAVLPKSPLLKMAEARIFLAQGNSDRALEEVEKFAKNFDHIQEVNFTLADILIEKKNLNRAYEVLGKYDVNTMKDPEFVFLRIKAFLKEPENPRGLGSPEAANRLMGGLLRKRPDDVRYRLAAAQIALLLQDKNSAVEHIDAIMKARQNFSPALSLRADFYREQADYDNAIPLYEEALKYTRYKGDIYRKLATGYKSLGKAALAIQYYQKVVQANPKDGQSHLELGKLYSDDGRYLNALASLQKATELLPSSADAYYFLGFVHKELGNRKGAIQSFEKFLALVPDGKEAGTLRDEIYFLKNGSRLR